MTPALNSFLQTMLQATEYWPQYIPHERKRKKSQPKMSDSSPPVRTLLAEGMSPAHTVTEWLNLACHFGDCVCRESTEPPGSWLGTMVRNLNRPRQPQAGA